MVGIQVIRKKVFLLDPINVHYIHHVHIVIVNNVHRLIIIKNLLRIHHRQIYQNPMNISYRILIDNLLEHWQKNDEEIYHVMVHFGRDHRDHRLFFLSLIILV
jgi:hypothetical protein